MNNFVFVAIGLGAGVLAGMFGIGGGIVIVPALILLATYLVLALGRLPGLRIDRTGAAVVGAIPMVTIGGLGFEQATRAVDYRTLVLLFGMMVLVAHLQMATFFRSTARLIAAHVAGRARW